MGNFVDNKTMRTQARPEISSSRTLLGEFTPPAPAACSSQEFPIGARLRRFRKEQKLSIRDLAAKCGLSANTLSLIENERTSPSVHTLQLLARGLGIPLAAIFDVKKPQEVRVYQQYGQRSVIRCAIGTLEKLGEGLSLGAEPILITLDPDQADTQDITHAGREFLYCLEGVVTCTIASQVYRLSPGDSLLFDASVPHRWLNPYPGFARLLVLFCPMDTQDEPAHRHLDS